MANNIQYRIRCETDGELFVWADAAPTECPVDGGHTLITAATAIVSHKPFGHSANGYAPTVNDDETKGYRSGWQWNNDAGDVSYVCTDASEGAAVWEPTTGGGGQIYVNRGDVTAYDFTLGDFTVGAFKDMNLSGIIPAAGASHLVHLYVALMSSLVGKKIVLKEKTGEGNSYNVAECRVFFSSIEYVYDVWVMRDANRIIEAYTNCNQGAELVVRGWMIDG